MEELVFICDRTQEDVDRVKELNRKYLNDTITDDEKEEWKKSLKGAFNLSDISRIEDNTSVIAGLVGASVDTKKWKRGDIPTKSDYERIRRNVTKIKSALPVSTPKVPERPYNTFSKWNDIEKILFLVYTAYERIISSLYYCDTEIYGGEGVGIL